MMIQGVIFDMDGVLVNNSSAHIQAFEIFCARYGVKGWREKIHAVFGMGNEDVLSLIMPAEVIRERGFEALGQEKEAIYREIYADTIQPMTGLCALLKLLQEQGIRCAVGSSGCQENVNFVLTHCNIADYFDKIVCGDMVTHCKPDPEIYLTTASKLSLHPHECLVFEDAKAGISAAKSAGVCRVVALTTTLPREVLFRETEADLIVEDFAALANLPALQSLLND